MIIKVSPSNKVTIILEMTVTLVYGFIDLASSLTYSLLQSDTCNPYHRA